MKRILVSILLLAVALLMSRSFSMERQNLTSQTQTIGGYVVSETNPIKQSESNLQPFSSAACPCDIPPDYPTVTLVLIAAVTASFTMATFIYGSQFIAMLMAG